MNQITVIHPYKSSGVWAFDDESVGLVREPFVSGADEVIELMKEVDEELRKDPDFKDDILGPLEVFGLDKFADSAIIIKARTTTKPIKQWYVGREFNRRLKMKFDERNIEIPFPHVTLYMGQNKDGTAPPLHVHTA